MYQQGNADGAQGASQDGNAGPQGDASKTDPNVVDAEFEEGK